MNRPLLVVLGACLCFPVAAHAEFIKRAVVMPGTPYETPYYVKTGAEPGPTVIIIGGLHGDEPAGYLAARKVANWRITRGTLIVMPDAHREAIRRKTRGYPGNMNKMFPGDAKGDSMQRLAHSIWNVIREAQPDVLVTLHESRDFHANDPSRFGQTFCFDFPRLVPFMERVMRRANADISPRKNKFLIFVAPYPTCPTYQAWSKLGVPATSIETSKTLPLATRVRYQMMGVQAFLDETGLGYQQKDVPALSSAAWLPEPLPSNPSVVKSAAAQEQAKKPSASRSVAITDSESASKGDKAQVLAASPQEQPRRPGEPKRSSLLFDIARFGLPLSAVFAVWMAWKAKTARGRRRH